MIKQLSALRYAQPRFSCSACACAWLFLALNVSVHAVNLARAPDSEVSELNFEQNCLVVSEYVIQKSYSVGKKVNNGIFTTVNDDQ